MSVTENLPQFDDSIKRIISKNNKTPAEKAMMQLQDRRLKERIDKNLQKSYRERIDELNKALESLPVHFDIPRVGPG